MPSFLNSAELKQPKTGGMKIWLELVINLFQKDVLKFLTLSIRPTPFIKSSVPICISGFHSNENPSGNYCWNVYEKEKRLVLSREVEKH